MSDELSLSGRAVIVTGSSRRFGRAMTPALACAGATVVTTAARQRDKLQHVAAEAAAAAPAASCPSLPT